MADYRVIAPLEEAAARLAEQGRTPMYVAVDGALAGLIAVADPIKATSREAIARLHRMGLEVVMLTGDNRRTAEAVAREAGVDRVVAEVLPEGKVAEIRRLQAEEGGGDGGRRDQRRARAGAGRRGIAIGTGTDIAMQAGDITLMRGDLRGVASAIALALGPCAP